MESGGDFAIDRTDKTSTFRSVFQNRCRYHRRELSRRHGPVYNVPEHVSTGHSADVHRRPLSGVFASQMSRFDQRSQRHCK